MEEFALGVIKKVGKKWYIYSHEGKKIAGPFSSKKAARKRLREIEFFKSQGMKNKNYIKYKVQAEVIDPDKMSEEFLTKAGIKKNPDLLYTSFKMCHANTNDNRDAFEDEELDANFDTAKFKPINLEHDDDEIVGTIYDTDYIKEPEKDDDDFAYVKSFGVIYKKKFPEVAEEVIKRYKEGNLFYSMEAWFDSAVCSECGEEFKASADYCEHLNNRFEANAGTSRILRGITFGGCGIVENPADKGATNLSLAREHDVNKGEDTSKSFIDTQDEEVLLDKTLIELVIEEKEEEKMNRAYWAFTDIIWALLKSEEVSKTDKLDRFVELSGELLTIFGIIDNNAGGKLTMSKRVFETDAEFDAEVSKMTKPLEEMVASLKEELEGIKTKLDSITQENQDLASQKEEADNKLSEYKNEIEAGKVLEARIKALVKDGLDEEKVDDELKSTLAELSDESFEVLRKTFSFKNEESNDNDDNLDDTQASANLSGDQDNANDSKIETRTKVIRGFLKNLNS
jgi:regulator of replication initiation timing